MKTCILCLWNDALWEFDDTNYTLPLKNTLFYHQFLFTGYNHIINPNNYNPCSVCNYCLLHEIYCCNFEFYEKCLIELMVKEITKNIPNELFRHIYSFLY